jgi:hypothetical protein
MTLSDVLVVVIAEEHEFRVIGFCGDLALNVDGDGGDAGLVAWRGSRSPLVTETAPQPHYFQNRSELRSAIEGDLMNGSACSSLLIGFPGRQSYQFEVMFGADGLVAGVEPTRLWD